MVYSVIPHAIVSNRFIPHYGTTRYFPFPNNKRATQHLGHIHGFLSRNLHVTFRYRRYPQNESHQYQNFIYLAPFVAILALTNAATIMYCFDLSLLRTVCTLIFLSASVKGMNVWLQNNMDKFTISIPQGSNAYNSLTINNA